MEEWCDLGGFLATFDCLRLTSYPAPNSAQQGPQNMKDASVIAASAVVAGTSIMNAVHNYQVNKQISQVLDQESEFLADMRRSSGGYHLAEKHDAVADRQEVNPANDDHSTNSIQETEAVHDQTPELENSDHSMDFAQESESEDGDNFFDNLLNG